jgi:hypothetical protein
VEKERVCGLGELIMKSGVSSRIEERKKMIDFFYYVRSIIYRRSLCECAAIGIIPSSGAKTDFSRARALKFFYAQIEFLILCLRGKIAVNIFKAEIRMELSPKLFSEQ